jgi:hypothetical protein
MKKLDLSIDDLSVESFETTKEGEGQGTVYGHHHSDSTCIQRFCTCTNGMDTACDYTCGTCVNDCATDAGCLTQAGYPGCH